MVCPGQQLLVSSCFLVQKSMEIIKSSVFYVVAETNEFRGNDYLTNGKRCFSLEINFAIATEFKSNDSYELGDCIP